VAKKWNRKREWRVRYMEIEEEIRDVLKSIKREEWSLVDYEFAYDMMISDFQAIRNAMDILNQSPKTINDIQKCLDTIHSILWKNRC
jgi:hypothetical protein